MVPGIFIVWLDLQHAKLFKFTEEHMIREVIQASYFDPAQSYEMYDEVAHSLKGAKRVLLLGPGGAKLQLKQWLESGYPELAKRILACEESEQATDPQIAAYASRYFRKII